MGSWPIVLLFLGRCWLGASEVQGQWLHPTLGRIKHVTWGVGHSFFLRQDGWLCTEGSNVFGQLGDATTRDREPGDPVCVFKDVKQASLGTFHTVMVQENGAAWACGRNDLGQLGDGTNLHRLVPRRITKNVVQVAAGCDHSVFLKSDGT